MIKGISLLFIIAVVSVSCQMEDKAACQVALENFFNNAQQVIPKGLTTLSNGADIDNYVVAYCQTLTLEELSEAVVSVAYGKSSTCTQALEKYVVASQMRRLNQDCIRFSVTEWKARHPIERLVRSGNPVGRLLKMTPEGWKMYQEGIFERFFTVAQACE